MKRILFVLSVFLFFSCAQNTEKEQTTAKKQAVAEKTDSLLHHPLPGWFKKAKFGVFVHYGVNGHFAHYQKKQGIQGKYMPQSVFDEGAKDFDITDQKVQQWADYFKQWGAKYAVLTTSQHPGFALWDTKVHDRSITKMSPYGKDLVAAWCEALRKNDIKVGLYFNHEDRGDKALMEVLEDSGIENRLESEKWLAYLKKRDALVKELVKNYGKIDLLWFDADWIAHDAEELGSVALVDTIVKYQPEVVFNNRLRHAQLGHYGTPEKYVPMQPVGNAFEVCDNLRHNSMWGYIFDPERGNAYRKTRDIIYTFVDVITLGGNYLLNIGPMPDGTIPPQELETMNALGEFITQNAEAIYGSQMGLPRGGFGEGSTYNNGNLYLFSSQKAGEITVKGLLNPVKKITKLSTGESLKFRRTGGRKKLNRPPYLKIEIPANDSPVPLVYKLELEGDSLQVQDK